jgi:hypothetical protein
MRPYPRLYRFVAVGDDGVPDPSESIGVRYRSGSFWSAVSESSVGGGGAGAD